MIIFPPGQWPQLYPYPLLHPAGRSSQVTVIMDLNDIDFIKWSKMTINNIEQLSVSFEELVVDVTH